MTRLGVRTGRSLPIWRAEALDARGQVIAATGEIDWSMDPQPRTFALRAKSIAAVRIISENTHPRGGPFATWSTIPITRIELER